MNSKTSNESLGFLSEFNNNDDLRSHEAALKRLQDEATTSSMATTAQPDFIVLDDFDVDDVMGSQQDLKELYRRRKAERLEEQSRAEVEKQRLEQIMNLCCEFGRKDDIDEKFVVVGASSSAVTSRITSLDDCDSSSSDTDDGVAAESHRTIKRCPVTIAEKNIPVSPSSSSLSRTDNIPFFRLEPSKTSSTSRYGNDRHDDDGIASSTLTSPVVDSSIDIGALNERNFASSFNGRIPGTTMTTTTLLNERKMAAVLPTSVLSETQESLDEMMSSWNVFYEGRNLTYQNSQERNEQMDLLRELQRDVIETIADIKQKLNDTEARQNEAVRELEMERALLEGEQQIQIEELDALEEKISSLEQKESKLLAEASVQRSKEMEKIFHEKEILGRLERRLSETKKSISKCSSGMMGTEAEVEEEEELRRRCLEDQDSVDNQRFLVDNLEFQQLEGESHYDEEREIVEKQLKIERDYLTSLSNQHQSTLEQIASQQRDLLKQVDSDVYELEKERHLLAEQFKKENVMLYSINQQLQQLSSSSETLPEDVDRHQQQQDINCVQPSHSLQQHRQHRSRLKETNVDLSSTAATSLIRPSFDNNSPRKILKASSQTLPRIEQLQRKQHNNNNRFGKGSSGRLHSAEEEEERQFVYDLRSRSAMSMWERQFENGDGGMLGRRCRGGEGGGGLSLWQNAVSGSEESSMSGSDPLSEEKAISLSSKEDPIERLQDMECLLVLARAEKLRLVEEQLHERDVEREALEMERKRRKDLERRLAEEIAKHNDVIEQAIKIREKEKMQSRPLTRYLPVRDRNLDLHQFVVAAGHAVDQCCHLSVTSTCCRGYLTKMGSRLRSWKRRWFVFDRMKRCLCYYGDKAEGRSRGTIYFQAIEDVFVDHLHQVKSPTPQLTFCVKTYDRTYYLVAPVPEAMRIWIDVIFTGAEGYQQFA